MTRKNRKSIYTIERVRLEAETSIRGLQERVAIRRGELHTIQGIGTLAGLSIAIFVGILAVVPPGSTSFLQAALWVALMLCVVTLHIGLLNSRTQGLAAAEDVLASKKEDRSEQRDRQRVLPGTLEFDYPNKPVPWNRERAR